MFFRLPASTRHLNQAILSVCTPLTPDLTFYQFAARARPGLCQGNVQTFARELYFLLIPETVALLLCLFITYYAIVYIHRQRIAVRSSLPCPSMALDLDNPRAVSFRLASCPRGYCAPFYASSSSPRPPHPYDLLALFLCCPRASSHHRIW